MLSTSKWPSESQFCERWTYILQKIARKGCKKDICKGTFISIQTLLHEILEKKDVLCLDMDILILTKIPRSWLVTLIQKKLKTVIGYLPRHGFEWLIVQYEWLEETRVIYYRVLSTVWVWLNLLPMFFRRIWTTLSVTIILYLNLKTNKQTSNASNVENIF